MTVSSGMPSRRQHPADGGAELGAQRDPALAKLAQDLLPTAQPFSDEKLEHTLRENPETADIISEVEHHILTIPLLRDADEWLLEPRSNGETRPRAL